MSGTAIGESELHNKEIFSPLERDMDVIANRFGNNSNEALLQLNSLDKKITSTSDFSILNAYRCFLAIKTKNTKEFEAITANLKKKNIESSQKSTEQASVQAALGLCAYYNESNAQKRDQYLASAYHYVKTSQAPTLRYWIGTMYTELASQQGRARDAIDAATIALNVARANQDERRQSAALSSLAMIEIDFDDKQVALKHINEAIDFESKFPSTYINTQIRLNRAFILTQLKSYKEALAAYKEIETIAVRQGEKNIPPVVWSNYADIFYAQGHYQKAQFEVNRLLNWAIENKDDHLIGFGKVTAAVLAIEDKKIELAQQLFEEAIHIFKEEERIVEMRDFYSSMANAYARNGFYKQAYTTQEHREVLSIKIEQESRGHAANELRELLNIEEREKENIRLQAEIANNKLTIQNWFFLALLLLLGLIWSGQLIMRARRRNFALEVTNTELDTERYQDPMTLLFNRRYIIKNQTPIWNKIIEHRAAILIVDVDHFKSINDAYGHPIGDIALIEIAKRIKLSVRESDIVVRWGGEEFVVFSFACSVDQVQAMATRIMAEVHTSPMHVDDKEIPLSVSIGYVHIPLQDKKGKLIDFDESIKLADSALYLSKSRGRNRAIGVESINCSQTKHTFNVEELQAAWDSGEIPLVEILGP